MKKVTYFAIFEPTDTGFSVYFPDLSGCISIGDNFEHAAEMAKEALGLHLWSMEKDGDKIPIPTTPPFDFEIDGIVVPITIFPNLVKGNIENRAVKKTLTIPYWLNELAEEQNINFSNILQNALKDELNVR
jgi:predicted RNase H-like HicB family nuclease